MVGTDVRVEDVTPSGAVLEAPLLSGAAATSAGREDGITEPALGTVALGEKEVLSAAVRAEAVLDRGPAPVSEAPAEVRVGTDTVGTGGLAPAAAPEALVGADPLVEIKVLQKAVVASVDTGSALAPGFSEALVEAEVGTNVGLVSAGRWAVEGPEVALVPGAFGEKEVVPGAAVEAGMTSGPVADAGMGTEVPAVEDVAGTESLAEGLVPLDPELAWETVVGKALGPGAEVET